MMKKSLSYTFMAVVKHVHCLHSMTMSFLNLHLSLLFFLLLSFATLCLSYEPRNHEVEALITIRNSMNDPHGVLNNWDEDSVDPCSWAMITCSPDNLVTGLGAPSQGLSGTLSGMIANLTNLRQVLLQNNNISGQIPPELGALPNLQTLDLSNNGFSGHVPDPLGLLSGLQYLRLNNNSLSGAIPLSLAKVPQLAFFVVGNPLICGSHSTEGCSGSAIPIPLSSTLNSWTGTSLPLLLLRIHGLCDPKIIHRDVKAANILLDDYCEAVVGDFGLAKLLDHADSHVTTAVRGTVGHIAPEYLSTGQSSEKTDVFGFGILLIELITGMRALEFGKTVNQKGAMLEWVRKVQQEKKIELLVDRELGSNYDRIEVGEMLQVALLCTQYLPAHRPKMSEVVRMLEGEGLAEKWAASHNHVNPNTNSFFANKNNKIQSHPTTVPRHEDNDHDMFGMVMDDDYDSHAMELSGPR
ncbi:hypothetical protein TEA_001717 [Camellia sinensis var. sinensis]|uniref:Protein kinase domain-containing protein n=1 Tax=Camellia sinensis var. sinensis TaxID=542762 RepID=A0A4S4DJU6_CAMSN|nr:hypothetical protein TEA_001717 [Camellia sinensis var. sinensis]